MNYFEGLIIGGTGETLKSDRISEGKRVLPQTIETIKEAYQKSVPQVKALAEKLKGPSFYESCKNIYFFVVENIRYKKDTPGFEQIRTAVRTWKDRFTGVDCEDYTVLISAILTQMGYTPKAEIVGFGRGYAHIYALGTHQGQTIIIDTTPYMDGLGPVVPFNTRPAGIVEKMEIELLNGISGSGIELGSIGAIAGIGGYQLPAPATKKLLDAQSIIIQSDRNGIRSEQAPGKLRAIRTGIILNGMEDQDIYLGALPFIVDVKESGGAIYAPGTDLVALGEALAVQEAWQKLKYNPNLKVKDLEGIGGLSFNRDHQNANEYLEEGIGSWLKRTFNKVKSGIKKVGGKVANFGKKTGKGVVNASKTVARGVKDFVKNPLYYINKINPATIILRNAVLAALRLNLFKMSTKLKWAYLSQEEAQKRGYNMAEWQKLRKGVSTLENIFNKLGGEKSNLKNAITKGGGGLGNLGEPATATSTAAATPILMKIWNMIKGIDFKSLFGKNPTPEETAAANTEVVVSEQTSQSSEAETSTTFNTPEELPTAQRIITSRLPKKEEDLEDNEPYDRGARMATNSTNTGSGNNVMLIGFALAAAALLLFK
jgi:hypothetical protein